MLAIPLFFARRPINASLGAAKAPLLIHSKILLREIVVTLGKQRIILEHNAMNDGMIKRGRLSFIRSKVLPVIRRSIFDKNSEDPSIIPSRSKDRPNPSMISNGIKVIPIVVETPKIKFIKNI